MLPGKEKTVCWMSFIALIQFRGFSYKTVKSINVMSEKSLHEKVNKVNGFFFQSCKLVLKKFIPANYFLIF